MSVTLLMPMAGRGSRFARRGETLPKPLIPVYGIPMFRIALASLRASLPDAAVVCVVLQEHVQRFQIADRLRDAEPSAQVVVIPDVTGGSLETCLAAEPRIRDGSVVVLDCDLTFSCPSYVRRLEAMSRGIDASSGLLLSFRSRLPQYSYAEVVGDRVVRTAEKQPISDQALTGAYAFGQAASFWAAARHLVENNLTTGNGEHYVSSVYNRLIADGGIVRLEEAERVWSVGTPEEFELAKSDPAFRLHLGAIGLDPDEA